MRIPLFKRVIIALLNIFFPPLAVALLCGPNEDLVLNCVLFCLAVIPSHVHGFYISLTYFNRKRRARRGVYPGAKKSGIWSEKVNTGGIGRREAERLKYEKEEEKRLAKAAKAERPSSLGRMLSGLSTPRSETSRVVEEWDDGGSPGGFYKEYEDDASERVGVQNRRSTGMGSRRSSGRGMPRTSHRARRERPRYYDDEVDY
ncbi:hypothetical protein LTR84_013026 [Exophiala bonariae]|uniref:Stress response RCI peptide n=1 Tax=Exophiala bonariae TaxID=1690606 RepID=A0AAV9NH50_9EURO|nr:hypothetical protein LTR84_013026 [Exophiala bonariae]